MQITETQYRQLTELIKKNTGIDLGPKKQTLVVNRLRSVFLEHNIESFDNFYRILLSGTNPTIESAFIDAMTTNYTYFMREPEHFKYLQNVVLPQIKQNTRTYDLRIWCAACSSGQEAYVLAMLIDEFLGNEKNAWDRKLLATDISEKMLLQCNEGIYDTSTLTTIPDLWKTKYFTNINKNFSKVSENIKSQIVFGKFNLMTELFPFKKKFNVIFCRNVMIYFDETTRSKLIQKFYDSLEPGGYLFIGHSETIESNLSGFKYVMPAVYRKEF